ncbi:MAG: hypothetical protein IJV84_08700 [Bacteroidales bacterium]|nr:hypothetical protein [Bacteroidales bacterium]MBQ9723582.1 hypothetical protein [Bacteroidales bacterium]
MKQNSTKSLKWLTGVAVFFSLIAVARMTVQTLGLFYGRPQPAVWIDGLEVFQGSIAILRLLGGIALFGLLIAFLLNSIKGLKSGVLFPRKNISILFWAAAASFIFLFCNTNIDLVLGKRVFQLDIQEILVPTVICAFAIMYKVACKVSEENSLTI